MQTQEEKNTKTKEKKHVELSNIHNFAAKLLQPAAIQQLKDYVQWQAKYRNSETKNISELAQIPDYAPISINLISQHLVIMLAITVLTWIYSIKRSVTTMKTC